MIVMETDADPVSPEATVPTVHPEATAPADLAPSAPARQVHALRDRSVPSAPPASSAR